MIHRPRILIIDQHLEWLEFTKRILVDYYDIVTLPKIDLLFSQTEVAESNAFDLIIIGLESTSNELSDIPAPASEMWRFVVGFPILQEDGNVKLIYKAGASERPSKSFERDGLLNLVTAMVNEANLANKNKKILATQKVHEEIAKQFVSTTKLEIKNLTLVIPAPTLMSVGDFSKVAFEQVKAIEFIYFLFSSIVHGSYSEIQDLSKYIKRSENVGSLEISDFSQLIEFSKVQPLRVLSARYGSPMTFDLLGIGNILEVTRDIIKDLSWRTEHEKYLAEIERKNKNVEVEKGKIEIMAQKMAIEKTNVGLALQKIELLEKVSNLPLSDDEKRTLVSALVPKMLKISEGKMIVDEKSTFLLSSKTNLKNTSSG